MMNPHTRYIFHQTRAGRELARLKLIERYHDPRTRQRLLATGIQAGWNCLEIGPGAGSIMRWLSRTVGPTGAVVAVDINPRFVHRTRTKNIQVVQGDIATTPLPATTFHLIHARFVCIHSPHSPKILTRLVNALRPGGWLVLEEPDFSAARVAAGSKATGQSVERVNRAIMRMFENAGLNPAFGLNLPARIQKLGLVQLAVDHEVPLTQGGSPLARIMKASAKQLTPQYLATGVVSKTDINRYVRFADHPESWAIYHGTIAIRAQRPKAR